MRIYKTLNPSSIQKYCKTPIFVSSLKKAFESSKAFFNNEDTVFTVGIADIDRRY